MSLILLLIYTKDTYQKLCNENALRITSTAPTALRITDHDFQVGDYTIPAGWIFMGYPNVHFNPEKYDDPLAFNPWR
ncbi:putative cytochrome P450 [Arabidopsis thaliana]